MLLVLIGCERSRKQVSADLRFIVSPVAYRCHGRPPIGSGTFRKCRRVAGIATLRCGPATLAYELPAGTQSATVNARDVCRTLEEDPRLLREQTGASSCRRPVGRIEVRGVLQEEPVRATFVSCASPDPVLVPDRATRLTKLIGLSFSPIPSVS